MSEPVTPTPSPAAATAPPPPAALAEATARFERGDFLGARQEVARLLPGTSRPRPATDTSPKVATTTVATTTAAPTTAATETATEIELAARALLDRMAPDPWAVRIGLLVLVLLALVTGLYVR